MHGSSTSHSLIQSRPKKQNISGILLLDKPQGISSNKAVQITKHLFTATRCGHTGTLDPMASGLLPLCLGEATKFSSVMLGANKSYEATLKLGYASTTGDSEGEITRLDTGNVQPDWQYCEHILKQFLGAITQTPPMHSALKYQGKPLYVYARQGKTIDRPTRTVTIYDLQIQAFQTDTLQLKIRCSTGTYIRTLAEDIGKALGVGGAYLTQLRRTEVDRYDLSQAQSLANLKTLSAQDLKSLLLPVDHLLEQFPPVHLDESAASRISQGQIIPCPDTTALPAESFIRLYRHPQQFIGLGKITDQQTIMAKRLLVQQLTE